jgi:carboxylesterase type B
VSPLLGARDHEQYMPDFLADRGRVIGVAAEYRRAGAGFVEERIGAEARRHTTRDKES